MHMAFFQPGIGNFDKVAIRPHGRDRAIASIAHRRAQTSHQLVDHRARRSFIRHLPFDTFGHQLVTGGVFLKIPVGRATRHSAKAAHTAERFIRPALIQDDLSGCFIGASDHTAHHSTRSTRRDCLSKIARKLNTTISNDWHIAGGCHAIHHCR